MRNNSRNEFDSVFGSYKPTSVRSGGFRSRGGFNRFNNSSRRGGSRFSGGNTVRADRFAKYVNRAEPSMETEIYVPTHTFNEFDIHEKLKANIALRKFTNPSPIQDQAIPHALKGRDVLGIANTGTGKTAAFLIPLINKLINDPKQEVLILAPTRELALQIERELIEFTHGMAIYSVSCVGGAPIRPQIMSLRRGVNVVIGTPGRVMDLMNQGYLDFSNTQNIVLDEADRMLDMGFIDDIRAILSTIHTNSQKLFFSATLAREIEVFVAQFLSDPIRVMVKTRDTAKNVDQDIVRIERGTDKIEKLHELLNTNEFKKVLIFAETKMTVDRLGNSLRERGFRADSIHGDKHQRERNRTLHQFKMDEINILVATDVAARGLDIPDVSHVINFEEPKSYETYIHRIGRTGRANKTGVALTFVN